METPVQNAHGRLSLFNEAHSAVAVPLVLNGHAADLHHHVPQLFGHAPTFFRTWQLFAGGRQQLTELRRVYQERAMCVKL